MSLARTLQRQKPVSKMVWFCIPCRRLFDEGEDLDLHFAIIHPGIDKEGPPSEDQIKAFEEDWGGIFST